MIIDTHAHIGTLPPFDMTIEQVLYSMDKYGIDFTILSNIEGQSRRISSCAKR